MINDMEGFSMKTVNLIAACVFGAASGYFISTDTYMTAGVLITATVINTVEYLKA